MRNSLKQLLRTPAKSLLFFFLTVIATVLLTVGSVLYVQSSQRMADVEASFTTLGMVRQVPIKTVTEVIPYNICGWGGSNREDVWDYTKTVDTLRFEGAEYLTLPENRPYYIADVPDISHVGQPENATRNQVAQVVALEDSDPDFQSARVQVEKVLATYDNGTSYAHNTSSVMQEEKVIFVCQCATAEESRTPLQKGKHYMISMLANFCSNHSQPLFEDGLDDREYVVWKSPYCQQYDKDGNKLPSDIFPTNELSGMVEEITPDFWQPGGHGEKWEYWVHYNEKGDHWFTIAPVNDLQLIPAFQNYKAFLAQGREITEEEFASGALVCMLPDTVFAASGLQLGDKIPMSMLSSIYGAPESSTTLWSRQSPFNAKGELYEPFYEAEYEIVGTYGVTSLTALLIKGEIANDMVVIPAKSVGASDENNISLYSTMKPAQTTFLLKNGTIDAFETALREAVPDLAGVEITYNDNGYEEIMGSLRSVWITSILLFAVGLLAALATLLLLLYFFIVKQKKRTAIERSLGMSRRQCRVSLISGLLVLTLLASAVGSACGAVLMNSIDLNPASGETAGELDSEVPVEEMELTEDATGEEAFDEGLQNAEGAEESFAEFSTKFSLWATESNSVDYTGSDVTTPIALFFVIPLLMLLVVLVLSLVLTNRNLKIEPIYLLSSKSE